jgi:hypothetical protein
MKSDTSACASRYVSSSSVFETCYPFLRPSISSFLFQSFSPFPTTPVRTNHTDGGSSSIQTPAFTLSETGISDSESPDLSDLSDSDGEASGTPGLKPCNACLPHETMGCYRYLSSSRSGLNSTSISALHCAYSSGSRNPVLAYKPVAKKVRVVSAPLQEEYHVIKRLPDDPLAGLIPLPTHPPTFAPGIWFTQERSDALDLDPAGWLWPEELKLVQWLVRIHEKAFTWIPTECGRLDEQYFPPVKIPTIQHTPWVVRNMPIPAVIQQDMIQSIKDRITSGVYEPSTTAYHSCWFCVLKGDGKSLRLVHDLQPLNAVTIRDASTPPFVEQLAESFAGYAVYGMMDLFAGYDQRPLHVESRDMTTFSSPLGPQWLTMLLMGYTNAVQIYQADMSFILQEEIPHYTMPFIDDLPVKSGTTRYQDEDGSYETMPENPGIRRFIWEHLIVVNRILQHLQNVGATISAKKFILATLDAVIVGHKCTFEGRIPHEAKVQKIQDWPECTSVMHVCGFLGTCGVLHIFIRNFATIARPLVNLTRKGVPFEWGESQQKAMQRLKDKIIKSPALRWLDYAS